VRLKMASRKKMVKLGHNVTLGVNTTETKKSDIFFGASSTSPETDVKSFGVSGRGHSLFINGFNSKR